MGRPVSCTEEELVALLLAREESGFSYLYDHYSDALYGVLMQIIKHPPETVSDLLQDVFVKVWNNIHQYDPTIARLYTWLLQVTRNTALDFLKSKQHRNLQQNQTLPDAVFNTSAHSVTSVSEHMGLSKILEQLDTDKKILVELAYYKGFTQDEISRCLNIPLGTVKTRLRAAMTTLRDLLKDYK